MQKCNNSKSAILLPHVPDSLGSSCGSPSCLVSPLLEISSFWAALTARAAGGELGLYLHPGLLSLCCPAFAAAFPLPFTTCNTVEQNQHWGSKVHKTFGQVETEIYYPGPNLINISSSSRVCEIHFVSQQKLFVSLIFKKWLLF